MTEPRLSIYTAAAPAPPGEGPASFGAEAARLVGVAESLIRGLEERQRHLTARLASIRQEWKSLLEAEANEVNHYHDWIEQRTQARADAATRLQAGLDQLQETAAREARAIARSADVVHGALHPLEAAVHRHRQNEEAFLTATVNSLRLATEGTRGLEHDLTQWSAQSALVATALERLKHRTETLVAHRENQAGCRALQLGDPGAAEGHFQNALRQDPTPRALDNLALAHLAAQHPADARRLLEDPRFAQLPFATIQARRSQVALDSGDPARSLEEAETGLRSDPNDPTLLRLASTAALATGRAAAALRHLRRLCALSRDGGAPPAPSPEPETLLTHRLVRPTKTVRVDCR